MPTRTRGSFPSTTCLTTSEVSTNGGQVIENNDGSVSLYIPNNVGTLVPVALSKICCQTLNTNYLFDINTQKCYWSEAGSCDIDTIFKLVLNPKGNDGSIFYVDAGETCQLEVDFDYLFKVKCETINSIISGFRLQNPLTLTSAQQNQLIVLNTDLDTQEKLCLSIQNSITATQAEINATAYSIECVYNPTPPYNPNISQVKNTQRISGFGRFPSSPTAPFSFPAYTTGTYCLTEPAGLSAWASILGSTRYQKFLDGEASSYSCADVQVLANQNTANILSSGPVLMNSCSTPFGTKTSLIDDLNVLILQQQSCNSQINFLTSQINNVQSSKDSDNSCSSPIEFFETFSVSMTVDIITSANTLQTVYEQPLFGPIGVNNLYTYLLSHPTDSGFYVCGDPMVGETGFTSCTPLTLNGSVASQPNVSSCDSAMNNLLTSLYYESGLTDPNAFDAALPDTALASNWLHFSTIITDPNILNLIYNQKIKISFKINNACSDFCVLVDDIVLDKICTKVTDTNIFLTQSPGFELDRIRDNKKSWLANTSRVNRPFVITNNQGGNAIRSTNYDVNDERLVINTKEIDLDINIAAAIETDVWCYIVNNPCLLSSCSCPAGYDLSADMTECIQILTTDAILSGTPYTGYMSSQISSYNNLGVRFYENITNKTFPLTTQSSGGLVMLDGTGGTINVQTYTNLIYSSITSTFWGDAPSTSPTKGRLNNIGVWSTPYTGGTQLPINEWIGFTKCIDVPQTNVYYIGIAGDNQVRFSVNGIMIAEFANNSAKNFNFWHVFPITLESGVNIIEMQGLNSASQASFGAEIYNPIDFKTLTASTSTATTGNLFSTADMVGETFILADNNGYSCPTGYALSTCSSGTPYCVQINKIPMTGCVQQFCDPCYPIPCDKQFMDDECFYFMDSQVYQFMDSASISGVTNGTNSCCGDNRIGINALLTQDLSKVTTIEDFEYYLTSELIDAKNRQTISAYPTLRALYDRYMNSEFYCGNDSSMFTYLSMDQFASLIDNYWVDIVEQVVPATTIWGSVLVYSNTIFDQQKYRYRSYTSLFCGNPYVGDVLLSPINGTTGTCAASSTSVEVSYTPLHLTRNPNVKMKVPVTICNDICLAQMNAGSEFIGSVTILGEVEACETQNTSQSNGRMIGGTVGSIVNECTLQVSIDLSHYPVVKAVAVGAQGFVGYLWDDGTTNQTTIMTATSISVTVADANCCEATAYAEHPLPTQKACWYSMAESPEYVLSNINGYYGDFTAVTFTMHNLIVNSVEHITGATLSSNTITSATVHTIVADNLIVSGSTTGVTYTDFVTFFNNAFTMYGLTGYTAQISTNIVGGGGSKSADGFYIIYPISDTFEINVVSSVGGQPLSYRNGALVLWDGSFAQYYGINCSNIDLQNGIVIE
jgi:hypothetical protein